MGYLFDSQNAIIRGNAGSKTLKQSPKEKLDEPLDLLGEGRGPPRARIDKVYATRILAIIGEQTFTATDRHIPSRPYYGKE